MRVLAWQLWGVRYKDVITNAEILVVFSITFCVDELCSLFGEVSTQLRHAIHAIAKSRYG